MSEKQLKNPAGSQSPEEAPSVGGIVIFVVFILSGAVWWLYDRQHKIAEGHEAASWPHTTGEVLRVVRVERCYQRGRYGLVTTNTQEITVRYNYQVEGRQYEGVSIHPVYGPSGSVEPHRSLEEVLQRGQKVRVYYHKDDPARCTLTVGDYSDRIAGVIVLIDQF